MQQLGADGIKKCLGQFRAHVIDQQTHIVQLDLAPDFIAEVFLFVFVFHDLHAFFNASIVKADPFARGNLRSGPVAAFKMQLCTLGTGAEQAVMLVKTIKYRARDIKRDLR